MYLSCIGSPSETISPSQDIRKRHPQSSGFSGELELNPKRKVAVLISSPCHMFSEGIKVILGNDPHIGIVYEVEHVREIPKKVKQLHPDVLLFDIPEQDHQAIAVIRHAKKACPTLTILALTISWTLKSTTPYRKAGVSTFIRPDAELRELLQIIHAPAKFAIEDKCGVIRAAS